VGSSPESDQRGFLQEGVQKRFGCSNPPVPNSNNSQYFTAEEYSVLKLATKVWFLALVPPLMVAVRKVSRLENYSSLSE
jgi:hypothetical protein